MKRLHMQGKGCPGLPEQPFAIGIREDAISPYGPLFSHDGIHRRPAQAVPGHQLFHIPAVPFRPDAGVSFLARERRFGRLVGQLGFDGRGDLDGLAHVDGEGDGGDDLGAEFIGREHGLLRDVGP
jgi:hypothetical protein